VPFLFPRLTFFLRPVPKRMRGFQQKKILILLLITCIMGLGVMQILPLSNRDKPTPSHHLTNPSPSGTKREEKQRGEEGGKEEGEGEGEVEGEREGGEGGKGGKGRPFLFVGILSDPSGNKERRALRNSWVGRMREMEGVRVHYAFFLGSSPVSRFNRAAKDEARAFGDIVFVDVMDSSSSSSSSSTSTDSFDSSSSSSSRLVKVLAVLEEGASKGADCVMKVDDDVFFDPTYLHFYLSLCQEGLVGNIFYEGVAERDLESESYVSEDESYVSEDKSYVSEDKSYVSEEKYGSEFYPEYPLKSLYFLSKELVKDLVGSKERLGMFRMEDVGMGMWVAEAQERSGGRYSIINLGSPFFSSPEGPCWSRNAWYSVGLSPQRIECLFSHDDFRSRLSC